MKYLCFILFVAVSQAFVVNRINNGNLAAPFVTNFTTITPPGFKIGWKTILSSDVNDPVLGYKVKLWEYPGKQINTTEAVGNELLITTTYEYPTIPDSGSPPAQVWQTFTVPTGKRELTVNKLEYNVLYEIRIQAYTNKEDGPLSSPRRLAIEGP